MAARLSVVLCVLFLAPLSLLASGEAVNGFPKWEERVILEWTNRARSDPQFEMAACGTDCVDAACYAPIAPVGYALSLNRSARFQSDYISLGGVYSHDNVNCQLKITIGSLYPATCNGAPGCACLATNVTTLWTTRLGYFGTPSPLAENIAFGADPNFLFYLWLFEANSDPTCTFQLGPPTNGHRWIILKTNPAAAGSGWSASGNYTTLDFGGGTSPTKIVSGAHYPQQAATVSFWTNWYDTAGAPRSESVLVDGVRYPLALARGTTTNGAWTRDVAGLATGCHRYYFSFKDSASVVQRYPTTGTYGVGAPASCPDWAAPIAITTPISVPPASVLNTASVPNTAGSSYAWTLNGGVITSGQGTSSIQYTAALTPGTRMTLSVIETPAAGATPKAATTFVMVDFLDVPPSHPQHDFIVKLAANGVTGGCGGGNYCPNDLVLRSQMAIFLLRGEHGEGITPPAATGIFSDVAPGSFGANFIEALYGEGVTGGCATNPLRYCPNNSVLRSQMAIFLLRAEHGASYVPPTATGIFADVTPGSFGADFIEQLYTEGVTGGCATNPLRYCPNDATNRAAMAVFLTRTFNLQ